MQKSLIITGVVLVVAVAGLVAQQAIQDQHRDAAAPKTCAAVVSAADSPTTKPASPYVNVKCPIMKGDIDPAKVTDATTRVFNGQKVAFCCAGCPAQWDKLSDKEKQAKLDAVKAPTTEPAEKTPGCGCGQ
jgi:hypothetical protein